MIIRSLLFFLLLFFVSSVFGDERIIVLGLLKDRVVISIDGKRQVLNVGEKTPAGAVLISAASDKAIFEINGEPQTYKLGEHISTDFSAPKRGKQVVIAPTPNGMYLIQGSINGFQTKFIIDTGATLISMNAGQAKRFGINYKLDGKPSRASTASGIDQIYIVNLKTVKLGDIKINNVAAAVHIGHFPETTLLGNSFLNRIDMQRNGKLLMLEKKY